MKKILYGLGVVLFTYAGLWLALVAKVSEPLEQGGLAVLAAISFSIAILFVGLGTQKKDERRNELG